MALLGVCTVGCSAPSQFILVLDGDAAVTAPLDVPLQQAPDRPSGDVVADVQRADAGDLVDAAPADVTDSLVVDAGDVVWVDAAPEDAVDDARADAMPLDVVDVEEDAARDDRPFVVDVPVVDTLAVDASPLDAAPDRSEPADQPLALDAGSDGGVVAECTAASARACYSGTPATAAVGVCHGGTQSCVAGVWSACTGEVLPAASEVCGNGADDNCNGSVDEGCSAPTPAPHASSLSLGNVHACVTTESHQTSCWGGNPYGQIGLIAATGVTRPTRAAALDAVQLASNENFMCLRRADGSVACTGINNYGQLGDGTTENRMVPSTVSAAAGATWIAAGYYHACAVVSGTVRCWGRNDTLQLGATTTTTCSGTPCSNVPVLVSGITNAVQVVGGLGYSCALVRDGTVRCWGDNTFGQMGIGATGGGNRGVTVVPGLSNVVQLAGGHQHVCAVLRDGTVRCWGSNTFGQFLDTSGTRPSPTAIPGLSGVVQLASSVNTQCARLTDNTLRCWGYNFYGQTGDGTTSTPRLTLATPMGLPPVADVAVGYWNTCARTASHDVWCWGWNLSGEVGDGTVMSRNAPVRVIP